MPRPNAQQRAELAAKLSPQNRCAYFKLLELYDNYPALEDKVKLLFEPFMIKTEPEVATLPEVIHFIKEVEKCFLERSTE